MSPVFVVTFLWLGLSGSGDIYLTFLSAFLLYHDHELKKRKNFVKKEAVSGFLIHVFHKLIFPLAFCHI